MDINQIKEQAEKEIGKQKDLETAKDEALILLDEKNKAAQECYSKWHDKTKQKTDEVVRDCIRFFKSNTFDVKLENDHVIASYANVEIRLQGINDCNDPMYLSNMKDSINHQFQICSKKGDPDYSSDENFLRIGGKTDCDPEFIKSGRIDDKAFINSLTSVDQVNEIKKQIRSFTDYYKHGISAIDELTLYIIRFGDGKVYKNFEEYFKDL